MKGDISVFLIALAAYLVGVAVVVVIAVVAAKWAWGLL